MSVVVKYFVPEDGDEASHPNAFVFSSSAQPTVSDIKKAFPLPGQYHFRFRRTIGDLHVWMDLKDDSVAPLFDGAIFAKVSRLAAPTIPPATNAAAAPAVAAPQRISEQPGASKPAQEPEPIPPPPVQRNSMRLINLDEGDLSSPSSAAAPASTNSAFGSSDILQFDTPASSSPSISAASVNNNNLDIFGSDNLSPIQLTSVPASNNTTFGSFVSPSNPSAINPSASTMRAPSPFMNTSQPPTSQLGMNRSTGYDAFQGLGNTSGKGGAGGMPSQPMRGGPAPPNSMGFSSSNPLQQQQQQQPLGNFSQYPPRGIGMNPQQSQQQGQRRY